MMPQAPAYKNKQKKTHTQNSTPKISFKIIANFSSLAKSQAVV